VQHPVDDWSYPHAVCNILLMMASVDRGWDSMLRLF
jgi:hypothetical protein